MEAVSRLRNAFGCRICWRITAITFLAILVVEAIILIPSTRNYERDRLLHLDGVGEVAARGILMTADWTTDPNLLAASAERWLAATPLTGVHLTGPNGTDVAVGEAVPVARTGGLWSGRIADGSRYEASWTFVEDGVSWRVNGRMDAAEVGAAVQAFIVRIIGLVLLIATAVTAATMAVVARTILRPVLQLREALCQAARSPERADTVVLPIAGHNELSEMSLAFNAMAGDISRSFRDLHDREQSLVAARAEADRANAAKSTFLASMSHELRTPLNAVIGYSEVMESEVFGPLGTPRYKEYAHDIHTSGHHLLTLINDILDLSKAEAGHLEIRPDWVELGDLVDGSLRMVQGRAEAKGITLDGATSHALVFADGGRLKQVILNLLTNAIKFTPHGGSVALLVEHAADGALTLSVRDSGVGIAAEDLERVFQPFEQASNHTDATAAESTGLGLSISRHLVELHGGSLNLSSVTGQGTTATLTLPADRVRVTSLQYSGLQHPG